MDNYIGASIYTQMSEPGARSKCARKNINRRNRIKDAKHSAQDERDIDQWLADLVESGFLPDPLIDRDVFSSEFTRLTILMLKAMETPKPKPPPGTDYEYCFVKRKGTKGENTEVVWKESQLDKYLIIPGAERTVPHQ